MISQLSHVMTLANSIIGVSVLAMPFCFKQCGIILATLVLLLSSILSRLACHFLVKSAVMSRRRNFELLAFHAFGHMGKLMVELFIIGFLVGTCIAFFVVMGDLGPQIMGKMINKNPEDIRTSLLVATSVFIVLPLGLLRNIDSLSSICTATIVFYICLVLKIVGESTQHIFAGDWYDHVYYWRPAGILQCLPIFSMALFCQTQLFEIYETIPNVSLEKMNEVVRGALNICTLVYLSVGFFGYIAFCTQPFTGNILMSFEPSLSSEMIKMGFVFSIAFSFPLVIFPCRASLNSLLFRRVYAHEPPLNYIPETRYRCLTLIIINISLVTGILIPNIEFVLGLVGSTIGVMICLIFPAAFFISISSKNTNERLLAQIMLFIGIWIIILGTYANLYAMEESTSAKVAATTNKPLRQINNLPLNLMKDDMQIMPNVPNDPEIIPKLKEKMNELADINALDKTSDIKDVRQEPPVPVERIVVTEKQRVETQKSVENAAVTLASEIKKIVEKMKTLNEASNKNNVDSAAKIDLAKADIPATVNVEDQIKLIEQKENSKNLQKGEDLINSDAIKKEESELAAAAGDAPNILAIERPKELKKSLDLERKTINNNVKDSKDKIAEDSNKEIHLKSNEDLKKIQLEDRLERPIKNEVSKELSKDNNIRNPPENPYKDKNTEEKKNLQTNTKLEINPEIKDPNIQSFKNLVIDTQEIKSPAEKLTNSSGILKGPILNALTKRTQKSSLINMSAKNDSDRNIVQLKREISQNDIGIVSEKSNIRHEDLRLQDQYSIPIALKMRNQTKIDSMVVQSANKSEESIQLIRRDILEDHEREKREVSVEAEETNTKATSDLSHKKVKSLIKDAIADTDHAKCSKMDENEKAEKSIMLVKEPESRLKIDTTVAPLIKTNVYLSEQGLTNAISIDPSINVGAQYIKVKQRDLKALNPNTKNNEI